MSVPADKSLPLRDFQHSLPMELLKAREAAMARFRPMLRSHGLTEQQWRVIRALAAYQKIDAIVDTQQNVRVIASVLEKDLRHAGMMVPQGAAFCAIDDDTGPDRLFISDHTALDPTGATAAFGGWMRRSAFPGSHEAFVRLLRDPESVAALLFPDLLEIVASVEPGAWPRHGFLPGHARAGGR